MSGTNSPHNNRAADARDICTTEPTAEGGAPASSAHSDSQPRPPRPALTRRGFLKTTGAMAGAAAIAGGAGALTALAEDAAEKVDDEQFFVNQCRGACYGGCRLKVKVRNGKAVQTEAADVARGEDFKRICAKGISWPQRTYGPERIKYPLRRVDGTERGAGEWERVTWDDAMSEIAGKWQQYREESGANSIFINSGGGNWGRAAGSAVGYLRSLLGASSFSGAEDAAGLSMAERTLGGTLFMSSGSDLSNRQAKTIFLMGCNAATSFLQTFRFVQDAQAAGAKVVHIDPVYNITSEKSDWYVPIRPATDTALLMAMVNVCISEGWVDEAFLRNQTVGPFLVKEDGSYLRASDLSVPAQIAANEDGTTSVVDPIQVWDTASNGVVNDGQAVHPALLGSYEISGFRVSPAYQLLANQIADWTPEKASEICDIPAADIVKLADLFANSGPSLCFFGFGFDHYNGGHQGFHAAAELMAVTGNAGRPGTGWSGGLQLYYAPMLANPNLVASDIEPGLTIGKVFAARVMDEKKANETPIEIRSVYYSLMNPVANAVDRQETLRFLSQVDFIVCADMDMTETASYADLVLPVAGWLEESDVSGQGTAPNIGYIEKAIDPLYESKTDYEICQLIAGKMGLGNRIPWTYEEYIEGFLDNDLARSMGITYEKLRKEKSIFIEDHAVVYSGQDGVYGTPTGKLEFYLESVAHSIGNEGMDMGDYIEMEKEHLAHFEVPHEAWPQTAGVYGKNALSEKYPLVFTGAKSRFRTHVQFFGCDWLLEVDSEPKIRLNPDDAKSRNIENGDYVRAFNDRGEAVFKADVNNGVRPGMVVYVKGWQRKDFLRGHYSDLSSRYTHPTAYSCYHFDSLCEIEKYEEA